MRTLRPTDYDSVPHEPIPRQSGFQFLLYSDPGQPRDAVKSRLAQQ